MLIKFGLIVPLRSGADVIEYLVPALIPPLSIESGAATSELWTDRPYSTCYFAFTTSEDLRKSTAVQPSVLKEEGFLPLGLFERLVGKAVMWSELTSTSWYGSCLGLLAKDMAILSFGSKRFRLRVRPEYNCIELCVEGSNPKVVHERIFNLIQQIIDEC